MKMNASVLLICIAVIAPLGCAVNDPKTADVTTVIEGVATVMSVDVPNRLVTIRNENGVMETLTVPDTVRNLPQLKEGDRVKISYKEALAAAIKKPGEGEVTAQSKERIVRSEPGAKPGGVAERETSATILVTGVDSVHNTLTFVGPQGKTRTIAVKNLTLRDYLKQLKPGDRVDVVYSEGMAITVEPAGGG
ncbi:MAG: hypothetical protein V4568_00760 [Pseudomonadota bacterium]